MCTAGALQVVTTDIRYLDENATPEWKRAYIDYRGAKKAIKRAAASLQNEAVEENNDFSSDDEDHGPSAKPRRSSSAGGSALSRIITSGQSVPSKMSSPKTPNTSRTQRTPRAAPISPLSPRPAGPSSGSRFQRSPAGATRVSSTRKNTRRRFDGAGRRRVLVARMAAQSTLVSQQLLAALTSSRVQATELQALRRLWRTSTFRHHSISESPRSHRLQILHRGRLLPRHQHISSQVISTNND